MLVSCYRDSVQPILPQRDEDAAGRADALKAVRAELEYAWDRPTGIAMAKSLPKRLGFPGGVIAQVAKATAELFANSPGVSTEGRLPSDRGRRCEHDRILHIVVLVDWVAANREGFG